MTASRDSPSRRRVLQKSGSVVAGVSLAGCSTSRKKDNEGETMTSGTKTATTEKERVDSSQLSLQKLGQTLPSGESSPSGGYSETDVRADGRYAVLGTKWGISGSYLVDLTDPASLNQVH